MEVQVVFIILLLHNIHWIKQSNGECSNNCYCSSRTISCIRVDLPHWDYNTKFIMHLELKHCRIPNHAIIHYDNDLIRLQQISIFNTSGFFCQDLEDISDNIQIFTDLECDNNVQSSLVPIVTQSYSLPESTFLMTLTTSNQAVTEEGEIKYTLISDKTKARADTVVPTQTFTSYPITYTDEQSRVQSVSTDKPTSCDETNTDFSNSSQFEFKVKNNIVLSISIIGGSLFLVVSTVVCAYCSCNHFQQKTRKLRRTPIYIKTDSVELPIKRGKKQGTTNVFKNKKKKLEIKVLRNTGNFVGENLSQNREVFPTLSSQEMALNLEAFDFDNGVTDINISNEINEMITMNPPSYFHETHTPQLLQARSIENIYADPNVFPLQPIQNPSHQQTHYLTPVDTDVGNGGMDSEYANIDAFQIVFQAEVHNK